MVKRLTRRRTSSKLKRGGGYYGTKEYPDLSTSTEEEAKKRGEQDGKDEAGKVYSSNDAARLREPNNSKESAYRNAFNDARGSITISSSTESSETNYPKTVSKDDTPKQPAIKRWSDFGGKRRKSKKHSKKTRKHRK